MAKQVQFRTGSSSDHTNFTGAASEITVDSDKKILVIHDGNKQGGYELVGVGATQRITNKDIVATGLNVSSGVSTLGIVTATNLKAQQLNVSGVTTLGSLIFNGQDGSNSIGNNSGTMIIAAAGDMQLRVNSSSSNLAVVGNSGGSVDVYHNNVMKMSTTSVGATVYGTLQSQQLNVSGVTTITGNLNAPGNYYVKLARTTDQTIPNGTDTLLGLSVVSDPNSWYSGITTRTTPTVAGTYHVDGMVNWQAGSITNNQSNIQLRKNGNTFAISLVGIHTFSYTQNVCGIVTMNGTTDYIEFTVYTGNPTSQDVRGTVEGSWTKMEIFKIN